MKLVPFRIPLVAMVCISPVVLLWASFFVKGLYPLGSGGWMTDFFAELMALPALLLAVSLFSIWIAEKIGPPAGNPRTLASMLGRARLPLAIATGGMATLPFASPLGIRVGGLMGVSMQPVRDLQSSTAVALIAASGNQGDLPEAEWPASLWEWKTPIWRVQVTPRPGREPEIKVFCGNRGSRFGCVLIRPANEPNDDDDNTFTRWTQEVWLGRTLGD